MDLAHDIVNQLRTDDIKINENADFSSLLLSEKTLSGLQKSGFRKPSPIQQQSIPIGKCGFDLVIKSKSGTGKTAVFAIIALEMIDLTQNCVQCLIIAPTREIAVQIQGVIETIGLDYTGLKVHSFIGGMPVSDDTANLQCCHIAVGAPGRLKHLIDAGVLKTDSVKLLVLDEADKLMEPSFYDDINVIYYKLPKCFQMIASSATYPNNLDFYISQYMHTPTHINALNAETPLLLGLRQFIATVRQTANSMLEKNRLLLKLLSTVHFTQCIVFSNYQTRAESVSNVLNTEGFDSVYISAKQSQPDRLAALAKLKSFQCRVILSTDLTARGIDASNVDLVVNYDVPCDVCTYLHRMGRAGRYGSRGLCVTLAENGRELNTFQKFIGFLGGANMSIAKLLYTSDWLSDELWKGDLLKFEQISGSVASVSNYEDVQKSLLELRQYKIRSTETNNIPTDCANLSVKTTKYSIDEISKYRTDPNLVHNSGEFSQLCDVLEPLIKSSNLNVENISAILKDRENCKKLQIMKSDEVEVDCQNEQLIDDVHDSSNDSSSKRKRVTNDNSPTNGFMPQEKKNLGKHGSIFQKNIGVLNVTRLLCDESTEVSDAISENIGQFLNQLKGTSAVNTENIPENAKVPQENQILIETLDDSNDLVLEQTKENAIKRIKRFSAESGENTEKLFQYAFDYAIDETQAHWLEQINEEFDENQFDASKIVEVQENLLEDFQNVDFDAMECDDADNDEDEEEVNSNDVENPITCKQRVSRIIDTTDYSKLSNEPSTSQSPRRRADRINRKEIQCEANPMNEMICNNKFNRFFMECGSDFLEKYTNYDEFVDFKDYWRNWKRNVHIIREFVQQKIYVEEMLLNKKRDSDDSD